MGQEAEVKRAERSAQTTERIPELLSFHTVFGSTSRPHCIIQASNENASWSASGAATTSFSMFNTSTTSIQWQWTNSQVLTAASTYFAVYTCYGN